VSDDRFDFDDLLIDQQERTEACLEAGSSCRKSDEYKDCELKPASDLDCDGAVLEPFPATVSGSVQFPGRLFGSCMLSESLSCGLVASSAVNDRKLQTAPLELTGSVNDGQETRRPVINSLSECMDRDQKKCEMAAMSAEFVLENSNAGPEEELSCRGMFICLYLLISVVAGPVSIYFSSHK